MVLAYVFVPLDFKRLLLAVLDGADGRGGCLAYEQAAMRIKHEIASGRGDLWQRIVRYRPEHGHAGRKELVQKSGYWADKLGLYLLHGEEPLTVDIQPEAPLAVQEVVIDFPSDPVDQAFERPLADPPAEPRISVSLPVAQKAARPTTPAPPGGTIRIGLQSGSIAQAKQVEAVGQLISTRTLVQPPVVEEQVAKAEPEGAAEQAKDNTDVTTRRADQEAPAAMQAAQSQSLHTDVPAPAAILQRAGESARSGDQRVPGRSEQHRHTPAR